MGLNKFVLGAAVIAMSYLCTPASAKDYQLFSLDYDAGEWVEMLPEDSDGKGVNMLTLFNEDAETLLSINSQVMEDELSPEEFQTSAQEMLALMKQNGMYISAESYDEEKGCYQGKGQLKGMPLELQVFAKDKVLLLVISVGKDIPAGLALAEHIKPTWQPPEQQLSSNED